MHVELGRHDHAILAYSDAHALRQALGRFGREGVRRHELVVFVHAFPTRDEAERFVRDSADGFADMLAREIILVSFYQEAFEGGARRIDFDHVVRVVDGLLARAESSGKRGLRIFVDASRAYLADGRTDEWFAFEERLGKRLHHAMALLCAYPAAAIESPELAERVLLTHLYRFDA